MRKRVNCYRIEFIWQSRFSWNKNGMEKNFMNVKSYSVSNAVRHIRKFYPNLIVQKVTFIH